MLIQTLKQWFYPDVAVDLGTANTRVAMMRNGDDSTQPSVCGTIPALRSGVIVDIDAAAEILRPLLHRVRGLGISFPRVLACAPSDTTREERDAVAEACYRAGAGQVALIPEPVAAAIGDGVSWYSPETVLLMDIGDGVTDCALIREGHLVQTTATRVACSDLHEAVRRLALLRHHMVLSPEEARRITETVGVGPDLLDSRGMPTLAVVRMTGMEAWSARPIATHVASGLVREALNETATQIVDTLQPLLRELPEADRREIAYRGIRLSGGGALLPGMSEKVAEATGLPVRRTRKPLTAVVSGAKRLLPVASFYDLWKRAAH